MNGTRNKSIQINIIFKYIFILDFLENVFVKVSKNHQMLLKQHFVNFGYFFEDIFQEVQDETYT